MTDLSSFLLSESHYEEDYKFEDTIYPEYCKNKKMYLQAYDKGQNALYFEIVNGSNMYKKYINVSSFNSIYENFENFHKNNKKNKNMIIPYENECYWKDEYNKCLEYLRICKEYYDHARQELYLHIIDLKDQLGKMESYKQETKLIKSHIKGCINMFDTRYGKFKSFHKNNPKVLEGYRKYQPKQLNINL